MTPEQRLMAVGAFIHGALYLAACVVIGYLTHHMISVYCGIAGFGMSFLCFSLQVQQQGNAGQVSAAVCMCLSLVFATVAGLALLF